LVEAHCFGCWASRCQSLFCWHCSGIIDMPRTLIEPHKGNKRYARRKSGKFIKSQDQVGRSLATDRRQHAKRKVKTGEGDRGDR